MATTERTVLPCDTLAAKPTRPASFVELIATAALAVSTIVALTAVSIGIARADIIGGSAELSSAPLAIALFIGLLASTLGGLAAMAHNLRR